MRIKPASIRLPGESKNNIYVVAVFRDEAPFLDEWIRFHLSVGIDKFLLFNDRSVDNFQDVLAPWVEAGYVELRERGRVRQQDLYSQATLMLKDKAKWVAFIDIDEFLYSPAVQNLKDILKDYERFGGVFVQWVLFGSAGHFKRPDGGILRNFTRCLSLADAQEDKPDKKFSHLRKIDRPTGRSRNGKSIVRPRRVNQMVTAHFPEPRWPFKIVNENKEVLDAHYNTRVHPASVLRINHYWSRSLEDLIQKVEKGRVWSFNTHHDEPDLWLEREKDLNSSEDLTILSRLVDEFK